MSNTQKDEMLKEMRNAGFDGRPFFMDLESVCESGKKRKE